MSSPADVKAEVRNQLKNALRGVRADIRELKANYTSQGEEIAALKKETGEQTKKLDKILGLFGGTSKFLKLVAGIAGAIASLVEIYRLVHPH